MISKIYDNRIDGKRLTNTRSLLKIPYNGDEYHVIYSKKHKEILTFLTPEWANEL